MGTTILEDTLNVLATAGVLHRVTGLRISESEFVVCLDSPPKALPGPLASPEKEGRTDPFAELRQLFPGCDLPDLRGIK